MGLGFGFGVQGLGVRGSGLGVWGCRAWFEAYIHNKATEGGLPNGGGRIVRILINSCVPQYAAFQMSWPGLGVRVYGAKLGSLEEAFIKLPL